MTGPASTAGFGIGDSPNWIAGTAPGAAYRFSAWVRSDSSQGVAKIKVREYVGGNRVGEIDSPGATLTPAWQRLEVDYDAIESGSTIDMTVKDAPLQPSESFDIDDVSICEISGPSSPGVHAALAVIPASVRVTDDRGAVDSASVAVTVAGSCEANLVHNPSFETDTLGWKGVGCTLAIVPGGRAGSFSCRMTSPDSTAGFGLEDSPNVVGGALHGAVYRFRAWVRSDAAHGPAEIKVREYLNDVRVGERSSPPVTLSPGWQLLAVDYVAVEDGSTIDLTVKETPLGPSESFDVDDIEVCVLYGTTDVSGEYDPGSEPPGVIRAQVAPNPLVRRGILRFSTGRPGPLHVAIYDAAGSRVRRLLDAPDAPAGPHVLSLDDRDDDGAPLTSGIYFYRIRSAAGSDHGRFLILR
ncbi:MAG TPA: FlgD immunoglobulin-like domain containing protein [Candidatus Eisenbacteria bacterium]|jgi:hypothetical protein